MISAHKIAVLIDISKGQHTAINQSVFEYIDVLKNSGKDVYTVAFTSDKKVPEGLDYFCFCKKELNWANIPVKNVLNSFITKKFDILFSLYTDSCKALDFLTAVSKSQLKVGYFQAEKTDMFDLMVHNSGKDFNIAIDQMHRSLMMINK
jgi:hypothetical protein